MSSKAQNNAAPRGGARSLALRLTLWYTASAFAIVAATTSFLYLAQVARFRQVADEFILEHVQIIRTLLSRSPVDMTALRQQVEPEYLEGIYIRVRDEGWRVIVETPRMEGLVPPNSLARLSSRGPELEAMHDSHGSDGRKLRAIVSAVPADSSSPVTHWIEIAYDRSEESSVLSEFRARAIPALLLALLLCVGFGYQIARRGLRPVHEISQMMLRTSSSTLGERVQTSLLPAELFELAETFNGMLDRLQMAFGRLARFSADLAHELRTPISNLRGEVEVALGRSRTPEEYREALVSCLEECLRLSTIIDSLLFLARSEDPATRIERERLDLCKELSSLKDYYEAAAAEKGVELKVDVPPALFVEVNRTLLQRALGNLVDNALRYTPAGGSIALIAFATNGAVQVGVRDSGSGIRPEDLPRVFERFYRADPSRSTGTGGAGLGLAIVKSIAELHGGSASASSNPGEGTTVLVKISRED